MVPNIIIISDITNQYISITENIQDKPFKESAPLIEALVADIKKNNPQTIQAPDTTQLEETK
jgi:hypothetical protein